MNILYMVLLFRSLKMEENYVYDIAGLAGFLRSISTWKSVEILLPST